MKFFFLFLFFFQYFLKCQAELADEDDERKSIQFTEDLFNHNYLVKIPPQPDNINEDNIAVFLFTDYFVVWIQGSSDKQTMKFYKKNQQNYKDLRSLNIARDFEIWENLIKPVKNGTLPSIKKVRKQDNSYEIKLSFPKAAIDTERRMKVHKLYADTDELVEAKIDYRLKLPKNPHYVRRTLKKDDGSLVDVFTVADEDSQYIKDMKEAIDSGNADLIQNDTMSAISVIQPDDYNHNLINFDSPKTDKTRHFE